MNLGKDALIEAYTNMGLYVLYVRRFEMKNMAFTGHREINDINRAVIALNEALGIYTLMGFTDFYAGGALGFDTLAAEAVIEKKKENDSVKLHLVLPCPKEFQTKKWNKESIQRYDNIMKYADTVEYLYDHYTRNCMYARNEKLVEYADAIICWLEPKNKSSGTKYTVECALKKGIMVHNLCINKKL